MNQFYLETLSHRFIIITFPLAVLPSPPRCHRLPCSYSDTEERLPAHLSNLPPCHSLDHSAPNAAEVSSLQPQYHWTHLRPPCIYQWSPTFFKVKATPLSHDRHGSSSRGQLHSLIVLQYRTLCNCWKPDSAPAFPQVPTALGRAFRERSTSKRTQPGSAPGLVS